MDFLNGFLTVVLVLVSLFMILLVLMQRGSANGGLGAAMGGGMAESALGAETSSVLSKWTRNTAIVFFILTFGLYLSKLHQYEVARQSDADALPQIESQAPADTNSLLDSMISEGEDAASDLPANAEEATGDAPEEQPAE